MKKEEALDIITYLEPFVGKKVYTINGGDFTIHSFITDLQADSETQFDVYVNLIPRLKTVTGQLKKESFSLFRSTYSILEIIELKVDLSEGVKRLCLFTPGYFEYEAVQFFTAGNKSFPQSLITFFSAPQTGTKCEVFEISNDLKRFARSEPGRLWASLTVNGINYLSNPLSFAKINGS